MALRDCAKFFIPVPIPKHFSINVVCLSIKPIFLLEDMTASFVLKYTRTGFMPFPIFTSQWYDWFKLS